MKKMIGFFALIASVSSLSAFAADQAYLVVSCVDARMELADAGYGVTIRTGGFTGMTLATVSEQTIAGPRRVAAFGVTESEGGMQRAYHGNGFDLTIELE